MSVVDLAPTIFSKSVVQSYPRPVEFPEFEDLLDREKFTGAVLYLLISQILRKLEKVSLVMVALLNLRCVATILDVAVWTLTQLLCVFLIYGKMYQ